MNITQFKQNMKKFPFSAKGFQNSLRKFGAFLAGMIMPLIGLITAWGLFTAIVLAAKTIIMQVNGIDSDQWDSSRIWYMDQIVDIGIKYVIPIVVGFFAGKQVLDIRGGVIGVIATLGVIGGTVPLAALPVYEDGVLVTEGAITLFNHVMVQITGNQTLYGSSAPTMIMGAMIFAPLCAFIFKKLEVLWKDNIKQGFEMLINNISIGLFGLVCLFVGFWAMAPFMAVIQSIFYIIINGIYDNNLLPLLPLFVETEKVLFLNNAVNHGIFGPLGYNEVEQSGQSVLFFMDPNPGQGMGLLLAYLLFSSKKEEKGQAAAAAPIHFIGGIHEVYYPFVLTKPLNLLWLILGGTFATFMYQIFHVGGIFTPSPGSIIMNYLACYPDGNDYLGLTLAIFGALAITFVCASTMLILERLKKGERVYFNPKFAYIMNLYNRGTNVSSLFELNKLKPVENVSYEEKQTNKKYKWEKVSYKDGSETFYVLSNKKYIIKFEYLEVPVINKKTGEQKMVEGVLKVKKYIIKYFFKDKNNELEFFTIKENDTYKFDNSELEKLIKDKVIKTKKTRIGKTDKEIETIEYVELNDIKCRRITSFKEFETEKGKIKKPNNKKELYWQLLPRETMDTLNEEIKKEEAKLQEKSLDNDLIEVAKKAKKIIFACEAGMGSSAMGAGLLRKYFNANKINFVKVSNCAIKDLPKDVDIVVTQKTFKHLIPSIAPNAYVYTIDQFLKSSEYDELINVLKKVKKERGDK